MNAPVRCVACGRVTTATSPPKWPVCIKTTSLNGKTTGACGRG